MPKRIAIVEVAQTPGPDSSDNLLDQVYRVCREVLDKAGLSREDVGTVVSASSDVFHGGVSCANAYYWDSGAAFLKNASRQDGESLLAFFYGVLCLHSVKSQRSEAYFNSILSLSIIKYLGEFAIPLKKMASKPADFNSLPKKPPELASPYPPVNGDLQTAI